MHTRPSSRLACRSRAATAPSWGLSAALLLLGAALCACKTDAEHYAEADRQVYALIEERRAALGTPDRPFTIEPNPDSLRRKLERGEVTELEPLSLAECLEIAAENSRDYQTQRESLYLSALDLTLERYRFSINTNGSIGAFLLGDGDGATETGVDTGFGLSKMLGTGAKIVGNLGLAFARDLGSSDGWDLITFGNLSITQPLLAGSNPRIVREPLTQAERNVVYAARSYERFRRTYAVDVSTRVYRILQQADAVGNEERNYANLQILRERNEALAESGRLSEIEVDQARQDELRSRNRLVEERQRQETLIDSFKLFLGLPIPVNVQVDNTELARLEDEPLRLYDVNLAMLDELALSTRLDYQTTLDQADDSLRKAEVAADALRSRLDLSSNLAGTSGSDKPLDIRSNNLNWDARLDADIAFDRFPERNRHREAWINVNSAKRDVEEDGDNIRANVRVDVREAAAAFEGYEIQKVAVRLADRRIESVALSFEAGRATTRDLLEAQEAQLEAKNSLTAALIDYQLARLALFRDLELLRVDQTGLHFEYEPLEAAVLPIDETPGAGQQPDPVDPTEQRP
jgi:outer membrane protein TolC